MTKLRKIYCKIPDYGQLLVRKGSIRSGWFQSADQETYYSLMVKGARGHWFKSSTFYLVFTEHCLNEAIERGKVNLKYMSNPTPFGRYVGIQHVEGAGRLKNTYDCIYLHVFKYKRGGDIEDFVLALSERQFRRAIARSRLHPELVVRKRWWHSIYRKIFRWMDRFSEE